jgi:hypothetical protein
MLLELNDTEAEFLQAWIKGTLREGYRISKDLAGYKASQVIVGRDLTKGDDVGYLDTLADTMLQLAAIGDRIKVAAA